MQSSFRNWMLPEGIVESLPKEAYTINRLEQVAINTFSSWGYQYLRPPIIEYADTFIANDNLGNLTDQTIQVKDQESGKQLGFRPDITPQVARIDEYYINTKKVSRYSYVGEVVRSYPEGHGGIRNPSIAGVELLGSSSWKSDVESVSLLIDYLKNINLTDFAIELGSVSIVEKILNYYELDKDYFSSFFDAFSRKDNEKILELCEKSSISDHLAYDICNITEFYGDFSILEKLENIYRDIDCVSEEIEHLIFVAESLKKYYPYIKFVFDLSDVHGYGYHNGLIFSAYVKGSWEPIARGGRYGFSNKNYKESECYRNSIGFNCNLNLLAKLVEPVTLDIRVIACDMSNLNEIQQISINKFLSELREKGDIVICIYDGIEPFRKFSHKVIWHNESWSVVTLK